MGQQGVQGFIYHYTTQGMYNDKVCDLDTGDCSSFNIILFYRNFFLTLTQHLCVLNKKNAHMNHFFKTSCEHNKFKTSADTMLRK